MKIIFSPSKGMKHREIENLRGKKEILFSEKTENLLDILRGFSRDEIAQIMKIKGGLLETTFQNYGNFDTLSSHRGIELYSGISYSNLNPESYSEESLKYMEKYLRILSALYGVITPETLIKEYRLDMTMKIGDFSLYSYWKDSVEKIFEEGEIIVNLASGEFSKMLEKKRYHMIDIEFRQLEGEKVKNGSTEAKKMRGKFLDFMIKNRVEEIEALKGFEASGYSYCEEMSGEVELFFVNIF
ncbi:MAG: YaaA family protein [Fusobacteriaceae bacterium]